VITKQTTLFIGQEHSENLTKTENEQLAILKKRNKPDFRVDLHQLQKLEGHNNIMLGVGKRATIGNMEVI